MADRNRENKKLDYPPELVDTKLQRLLIERNVEPSEALSGKVRVALSASALLGKDDEHLIACETTIRVNGESEDSGETAFTAECTIVGLFRVKDAYRPGDSIPGDEVLLMANYLNPIAAETIETQITRTGFGNVKVPRHFDVETLVNFVKEKNPA